MELLHTAIWVDDPDSILKFYTETLDLVEDRRFVGPDGAENIFLIDGSGNELQLKVQTEDDGSAPAGIDHIAIGVDDVDTTFEDIRSEWGTEIVLEPTDGQVNDVRIAFIRDPEGYILELIEEQ